MGIDIQAGSSPLSSKEPKYSVVILKDGELVASYEDLPLYKLLRLVIEHHVDVIAVDNVFELASSIDKLEKLMELIPHTCKIVQVTKTGAEFISTRELSKELFGSGTDLTPLKTAYLNALAALKGYGSEVQVFSNKTKIVITRGRNVSQGGMSQERFKRSIKAGILQATREIKKILDENNLEYDMMVKKSRGGLEKSVFIVYAPRESLYGLIKPVSYKNVKIVIKPFKSSPVVANTGSHKPLIMGIDPGMTVGVALIDLEGRPVFAKSWRTIDRYEIISAISSYGKVVVIATDVSNPPELVKKIGSLLGAIVYAPERDITVDEKNKIISELRETYDFTIEDSHVRDALVAALKAYRHYLNTILEVKSKLRNIEGVDTYSVISEVIKGRSLSEVIEQIYRSRVQERSKPIEVKHEPPVQLERISNTSLKERVKSLEAMILKLSNDLKEKEMMIKDLETEVRLLKSRRNYNEDYERKISTLEVNVANLARRLEEARAVIEALEKERMWLRDLVVKVSEGSYILLPKAIDLNKVVEDNSLKEKVSKHRGVFTSELGIVESKTVEFLKSIKGYVVTSKNQAVDSRVLRIPVIKAEVVGELEDYVVLKRDVEKIAGEIWQELEYIEALEARERIRKLIEEYQKSRGIKK
jgi:predicted RNase H-like nuclease (RuvC/YqgF family)